MANKVLLKKSSVTTKVPLTTDLDYGELALNYTDGKLFFKNASNVIKSFTIDDNVVTLAGTQTLTNKTLTSPTINGAALSGTLSGASTFSGITTFSGGDGTNSSVKLAGYNQRGGAGYHGFLEATNTFGTATNPNKYFRLNSTGALEIVNSAYTTTILALTDAGALTVPAISIGGNLGTSGQVLASTGTGLQWITVGGTGTVTSVALSLPSIFSVTGSPITTTGTLTASLASQTANTVFAAPNGAAGAPTFRALVAADIPTLNQNTTGTAATVTGAAQASITSAVNLASVGTITSGTWSGSFGAVSGANLTSLTAGNLTGTIPSAVLGNSTVYIGTTAVALNRASANLALTGILSETYVGATSGTIQLIPAAVAGTGTIITLPATTGTVVTTGDTGTVTNTMLAGSIATSKITGLATSATTDTTNAANISSGTLPLARLSGITTTQLSATAGILNAQLANSTISGVALGGTLNTLTIGTGLSGTSYNGSGAVTIALANTAVTAGSYGSSTSVPVITVDAQGRITSASSAAISGSLTFTGDVTGTGSTGGSTALTLAASGVTAGTYTKITVDAKGRATSGTTLTSADLPTYTGTLTSSQVTTALGYTPLSLGGGTMTGNLLFGNATSPNTNYIQFGDNTGWKLRFMTSVSGTPTERFSFTDNGAFNAVGAITQNGQQVLHASNYTSYSPSLTGSGASGTWGISITGNAATATTASNSTNLGGYAPNTTGGASTIVQRDTNGYIQNSYFYSSGGGSERNASGIGYFAAFNTSDYYIRSYTPAAAASAMGALTTSNYTSYSPSLTGSGASGTWGISVTGSSGSVSGLTLTSSANGINPDNVTQNQIGYNTSVSLFGQTDGGLYSSAYSSSWIHQIYGDFRTGQLAIRGKNSGTWQSWRTVVDSSNVSSYAVATGGGATVTSTTYFRSADNGSTSYTAAAIQLRESQGGGSGSYLAPRLAFHWGGVVASQIGIRSDGGIQILNNPGSSLENLWANNMYASGFQQNSDIRIKDNVVDSKYGLKEVMQLRSVEYDRKDDGKHHVGLIAQEVEKIIPEFVDTTDAPVSVENSEDITDFKTVNYSQMVSVLIKAVQELKAEVDELRSRLGE